MDPIASVNLSSISFAPAGRVRPSIHGHSGPREGPESRKNSVKENKRSPEQAECGGSESQAAATAGRAPVLRQDRRWRPTAEAARRPGPNSRPTAEPRVVGPADASAIPGPVRPDTIEGGTPPAIVFGWRRSSAAWHRRAMPPKEPAMLDLAAAVPAAPLPLSLADSGDYPAIRRAIEFIATRWRDQPSVEAVADHVGLSASHFQHLFKRWAGLTPKAFLQAITVERARELLREVLERARRRL